MLMTNPFYLTLLQFTSKIRYIWLNIFKKYFYSQSAVPNPTQGSESKDVVEEFPFPKSCYNAKKEEFALICAGCY